MGDPSGLHATRPLAPAALKLHAIQQQAQR